MKTEWSVTNVAAVGSPGRSERAILGVILAERVLANSGHICGRWDTLWCRNLISGSNNFTKGHLVNVEWLVANVTAVGYLDRAEPTILGVILAKHVFGPSRSF